MSEELLELEEARSILLQAAPTGGTEARLLSDAMGCVIAEEVVADRPIPPYDRAAMDGYAVRAADIAAASGVSPVAVTCAGEVLPGRPWPDVLRPGTCVAIMTGAPVPRGADAVVEVEATQTGQWTTYGEVHFSAPVQPGRNISPCGEDAEAGQLLLEPGAELSPQVCGLLALCGHTTVTVYRRPRVALLSTGNEIVPPDVLPSPYQVRDANRAIIMAVLAQYGFAPTLDLGIVRDDTGDIRAALERGLKCDVLLTSGGVSRGTTDLLPQVLESLGVSCLFNGVATKPGKPLWAGIAPGGCMVLALPGNPLAVLVHMYEMAVPLLRRMSGHSVPVLPLLSATLTEGISVKGGRLTLQPACVEGGGEEGFRATPLPSHGSADLVGMARANGYIFLRPEKKTWAAGERVEVRAW
ncbi:MAG: molybdopterin molybdotransferase MoeA [Armatimonadetes bacterium]|nr:molybdopterin molybdotransferase MoeA [Armatimonadota bacterium]